MQLQTQFAPGKINLYLKITGHRADGYHLVDTLLLPLDLSDRVEISVEPSNRPTVICRCPSHPELSGSQNLAAKAAEKYLHALDLAAEINICIHKSLWVAAGLGGGSSNAASVLSALNNHFCRLSPKELFGMAVEIGADVPFFLDPKPVRAQGIGEQLTPIHGLATIPLVLVNPGHPLSTADVYVQFDKMAQQTSPRPSRIIDKLEFSVSSLTEILDLVHNDLEPPATLLLPEIQELKSVLHTEGALAVGMTGSGPTMFGIFPNADCAFQATNNILKLQRFLVASTQSTNGLAP
ncbi:MAG: 4-(cytidine 5'-diphospho)-2-C-methyl-D-erythritol kinase [Pseudomonadota bacterium]